MMLLPEDLSPPPFTDDDLDAYFAWEQEYPPENDDPTAPPELPVARWQITDTGSAEYAMRRYAHTAARIEDVELSAAEFKRQIDEWLRREKEPLERRANWWKGHLTRFLQERREDPSDGRATVKLPSGDIVSRKVPARPEIVKEAEQDFIWWARNSGFEDKLVRTKYAPVAAGIKALVEWAEINGEMVAFIEGERVPGVVQVPEHVNYDVKSARP